MDLSCSGYLSDRALAGVKRKKKRKLMDERKDWILDEMLFEWASVRVETV